MLAAIGLRAVCGADDLRRLAKVRRDARQTRRLLALADLHGLNLTTRSSACDNKQMQRCFAMGLIPVPLHDLP